MDQFIGELRYRIAFDMRTHETLPSVSVVVPPYNYDHYVVETLRFDIASDDARC